METNLTPQQELFCRWYTTQGDTFGNATLSYNLAYDYKLDTLDTTNEKDEKGEEIKGTSEYSKAYNTCSVMGSRLLNNTKIIERKIALLKEMFDNSDIIDARTQEIILNGKDTDSIQAIKIHNDLKQRITKKLDITSAGRPLANLSDEELKDLTE